MPTTPTHVRLLQEVEKNLRAVLGGDARLPAARLDVLEGVAARLAGFSLVSYRQTDGYDRHYETADADRAAAELAPFIGAAPMPAALALATLAHPPLDGIEQRRAGAYYTDWRLATFLAKSLYGQLGPESKVVDAASGSGILLAAVGLAHFEAGRPRDRYVAELAHAADLSEEQLRATKLSLASLTSDVGACEDLTRRLRMHDSLVSGPAGWADVAPEGFDLVIGNPPWEKLRLTRHEHLRSLGVDRHYGADLDEAEDGTYEVARHRMREYVAEARRVYDLVGGGEADLYRLFLALAVSLARDGGEIAYLVPAGLIRSQGTAELRRYLLNECQQLKMTVLENRARYFAIDTRFKFLAVHAVHRAASGAECVDLQHASGTSEAVVASPAVSIPKTVLSALRPDLTVPEVRSPEEWRLFATMCQRGERPGSAIPRPVREVDMTLSKGDFARESDPGAVPVVEGRMVQAFRCGAKAYVDGTGRRARWDHVPAGEDAVVPQWWISREALPGAIRDRVERRRVGFCDIVGQTNERTMMAARIPAGSVCGNKVPTLLFEGDDADRRSALWLAVANSIAFDWLLRRVVTTTVNFFVLASVPVPRLDQTAGDGAVLAALVHQLEQLDRQSDPDLRMRARIRAEIGARALRAYGVEHDDEVRLILGDFPLLDRGQPSLAGEAGSTVTADLIRWEFAKLTHTGPVDVLGRRLQAARAAGARAFVPSEYAAIERSHAASLHDLQIEQAA
jgi:hypothetical protein